MANISSAHGTMTLIGDWKTKELEWLNTLAKDIWKDWYYFLILDPINISVLEKNKSINFIGSGRWYFGSNLINLGKWTISSIESDNSKLKTFSSLIESMEKNKLSIAVEYLDIESGAELLYFENGLITSNGVTFEYEMHERENFDYTWENYLSLDEGNSNFEDLKSSVAEKLKIKISKDIEEWLKANTTPSYIHFNDLEDEVKEAFKIFIANESKREVKGFKIFNPDWTCRDFQYEVGKTYEEDLAPSVCDRGFHFCKQAKDCFNYYRFDTNNKVAEVIALGEVAEEGDKCSTNKIQIVREVTWEEVLTIVNTGEACTGLCNSGDGNSGDRNSGHYNSGGWNSGDGNSGDGNSGNYNSGLWNSGHYNSGNCNSGDWNKASNVSGCFNTQDKKLMFFDKETDMTFEQWRNSDAYLLMRRVSFSPVGWVESSKMSDEEKTAHPDHETTGGYLKIRDNTDCYTEWWNNLSQNEKQIIINIPNFDVDKFSEITGVEVLKREAK